MSPETTFCGTGVVQGNVFPSDLHCKIMERRRHKASAKIPQSTLREKVTGEGKDGEGECNQRLPAPSCSICAWKWQAFPCFNISAALALGQLSKLTGGKVSLSFLRQYHSSLHLEGVNSGTIQRMGADDTDLRRREWK